MELIFIAVIAYIFYRCLFTSKKTDESISQSSEYDSAPHTYKHTQGDAQRRSRSTTVKPAQAHVEGTVRQAIIQGKNLSFHYIDKEGVSTTRTVRPKQIFDYRFDGGTMRCVEAYCYLRSADRTFAIFRMRSVEIK